MRVRFGLFLAVALIPCLASPALGHGGRWHPPPPPPPPPRLPGEPEAPPPPPPGSSGAPSGSPTAGTPAGGSPAAGSPAPSGPSSAGGGSATPRPSSSPASSGPGSSGRAVPVPRGSGTAPGLGGVGTGRARPAGASTSDWLVWWELNRDDILDLRGRLRQRRVERATPVPTGAGDREERLARLVDERVLPALRRVVRMQEMDADIRASAAIALAKCGGLREAHLLLRLAADGDGDDAIVEESAVLGLGMLDQAGPECRDALVAVLDDTSRRWRSRAFAALSLGLLGDGSETVTDALDRCFERDEAVADVPAAALLALGLLGERSRVPEFCDRLDAGRVGRHTLSDVDRSRVADALGRIGDPAALPALRRALGRRGVATRRAAMTAMGRILPGAPADVREKNARMLLRAVDNESDAMAAAFGAIALGRTAGASDVDPVLRTRIAGGLLDFCRDGPAAVRSYAALALGLLARPDDPRGPDELVGKIEEELRRDLARGRGNVAARGALALALGMMGDEGALPELVALLEDDGKAPALRAAAALAVGLVGDPANRRPVLLRLMTEHDRDLRIRCATASALLGGREAVPLLLEVLADPRTGDYVASSAAVALGPFADPDSVEPLLAVLEPDRVEGKHGDVTRAFAAVALGIIGARDDIRPVFRISKDLEFTSVTAALGEVVTIL